MQISLQYKYKNSVEKTVVLVGSELIIGRPKDIHIDIDLSPDLRVSRPHARLTYHLNTWWIEDLNSKHGTVHNGNLIMGKVPLSPGDQLQIGDTNIRVDFVSLEMEPGPGTIESKFPVSETDFPPSISEDARLDIFRKIGQIAAYQQGQVLLESLIKELILAFPQAEHWTIALIENDELVVQAMYPKPESHLSFTLARRAIIGQEGFLWVREVDLKPGESKIPSLFDVTAGLYAPLLCGGEVIGVVHVDTPNAQTLFSAEDLQLLIVLANIMGPAIRQGQNSGLYRLRNIFISYSPLDRKWVDKLAADLRRRSVKVWFDERLKPGQNRQQTIKTAICSTDAYIVVLSPSSIESDQVLQEIELAQRFTKRVIPLMKGKCHFPASICGIESLDMKERAYNSNIDKLADTIRKLPIINPPKEDATMKILVLAANPFETQRLHLDNEIREIKERLRASEFRDRFEIEIELAVKHSDLSKFLQQHKPHIVHFSGHGSKRGDIILQDESGEAHPVSPKILGKLFTILKDNLRCVVLNACWSAKQAEAIAQEVDCVVGISRSISDKAAIRFSSGFYQALGFGRNVQEAFDLGCIEIDLANIPESSKPKLIGKTGINIADIVFD